MRAATRLSLPTITLCAATSVNLGATITALRRCLSFADFADCLLFTDDRFQSSDPTIRTVTIERMDSASAYSRFMIEELVNHVHTNHVLVVQWDGFILDPGCWDERFLNFDYIGAPWPQYDDGHDVGNGGFSLRSKRLLEACLDERLVFGHPEDVAIARTNRSRLETEHGIRFAPREVAERFAWERGQQQGDVFGFHGIFNVVSVLGADAFWSIYQQLDERGSVHNDFGLLLRQLSRSPHGVTRQSQLIIDRLRDLITR